MEKAKVEKGELQDLEKRVKELRRLRDAAKRKQVKAEDELKGDRGLNDEQKKKFEVLAAREMEID